MPPASHRRADVRRHRLHDSRLRAFALLAGASLVTLAAQASAHPLLHSREVSETLREPILPESIRPVGGFGYRAILRLDRPGDNRGSPSPSVVTEDGHRLGPAHASRESINAEGAGRYLHWSEQALFFSASDNSDPRTNGRSYVLASDYQATRHTATTVLRAPAASYRVETGEAKLTPRRLILRNRDTTAAVTVAMRTEGQPDFTSAQTMVESIVRTEMSEEQKAITLWQFLVDWRYHHHPPEGTHEVHDPAKFLGVYGYGYCDDAAHNFVSLGRVAGLQTRAWSLRGHVVAEAFFDGAWHMFDPDHEVYFRAADGHIMSVTELAANPDVILQTEKDPIGFPTKSLARIYTDPGNKLSGMKPPPAQHRLAPTLLPKDEVTFDFGLAALTRRVKFRHEPPAREAANGVLVRQVDVARSEGELLIPVEWPYVILGGELEMKLKSDGAPEVALSVDGETFHVLPVVVRGKQATADLTSWVSEYTGAAYALTVRARQPDGAPADRTRAGHGIEAAQLKVIFQFAPRVLPQVRPGGTTFAFTLAPAGRPWASDWPGVEVVHEWDEPR